MPSSSPTIAIASSGTNFGLVTGRSVGDSPRATGAEIITAEIAIMVRLRKLVTVGFPIKTLFWVRSRVFAATNDYKCIEYQQAN